MIGSSIPHIADELRRAGVRFLSIDWTAGPSGAAVDRFVCAAHGDVEALFAWAAERAVPVGKVEIVVGWAACRGVTLGDVSVRNGKDGE